MNNFLDQDSDINTGWECIDPAVGHCIWELNVESTKEERKLELQAHLLLCDACRLDKALEGRLEKGLQAGELVLPRTYERIWWQRPAAQASVGSALIAACLALLIILPPSPSGDFVRLRGDSGDPHFLRPVEGEVVVPASTVLSWQPVDGATSYKVTLTGETADFRWIGTTRDTKLKLPVLEPGRQTLRAVLTTIPADLVSPGRVSVLFSTGSRFDQAQDRLLKAPVWLNIILISGVFLLGLSLLSRKQQLNEFTIPGGES